MNKSVYVGLFLIATLATVAYTTQVQAYGYGGAQPGDSGGSGYAYIQPFTAYDCTAPNPPPSCYNS